MTVAVFASFYPKPGHEAEAEAELRGMIGPTRNEPGNLRYDLYRISDGPVNFHLFEVYTDQAAVEAHRATAHYKAYRAKIPEYLAEPIGVKVLANLDVLG
jgi:quinol monooxygenase YgiN